MKDSGTEQVHPGVPVHKVPAIYRGRGWTRVGIGDYPIDASLGVRIYSWQEPTREEALEDHVKRYLL